MSYSSQIITTLVLKSRNRCHRSMFYKQKNKVKKPCTYIPTKKSFIAKRKLLHNMQTTQLTTLLKPDEFMVCNHNREK